MIHEPCISTASPDYEAEYHRHIEQIKKLIDENERLKRTIIGMCETLYGKGGGKE